MPADTLAKSTPRSPRKPKEKPFQLIERKTVQKDWGYEFWVINTPYYCGKVLVMAEGWRSSLHCHPIKDETMLIGEGSAVMEIKPDGLDGPSQYIMMRAEERTSVHIPPGTYHRLSTSVGSDAVIIEWSTTHDEDDVVRAELSSQLYGA